MRDLPNKRSDALELGETNYYTGKPCKRGHVDIRNAKTGRCLGCQREDAKYHRRSDYFKTDKWKAYQRDYHREYAQTEHGRAVKQAAYERWRDKRRAENAQAKSEKDSKSKR